jgi:hypothetical protein
MSDHSKVTSEETFLETLGVQRREASEKLLLLRLAGDRSGYEGLHDLVVHLFAVAEAAWREQNHGGGGGLNLGKALARLAEVMGRQT